MLGCAPADRIEADRAAMLPLPPVAPVTGWRSSLRLPRDHYLRLDSNDYSVHPAVVGRRVEIRADLERVQAFSDGRLVADHLRCWARHQTISDPVHLQAAAQLRHDRAVRQAADHRDQGEVQLRCLADYDAAFGLDPEGWPDAGHDRHDGTGSDRRAGLSDPSVEGAHPAPVGGPAGRTGPRRRLDP